MVGRVRPANMRRPRPRRSSASQDDETESEGQAKATEHRPLNLTQGEDGRIQPVWQRR